MPIVFIPTSLRPQAGGAESVEVEGANVRQLVEELDRRFPGFAAHLLEDGRLKSNLAVAVDGEVCPLGLRERVEPDSEVHFVPALAGGKGLPLSGECV